MATYFVEYSLSTDNKLHCFFGRLGDEVPDEKAREIIRSGLHKAFGDSVFDIEINRQTEVVRPNHSVKQLTLDREEES